jgi:cellulose synthase/poly-beta-1,6-N-acetylglucosamine synthase-like glycosyltransferase
MKNLRVIHRGPDRAGKGKSDVLNHGMELARGEVIGVFDADTEVDPGFIEKSIYYLSDPKVAGVQGKVRMYNKNKNLLTALQDDEFAIVSHLYQMGKEAIGGITALGGNGQFVKREALESVEGWNYMSPTEDLDLTFRLMFKGWDVRYSPQAVLWQEGVEKVYPFIRQRVRWAEGFLKCIFDYLIPLVLGKHDFIKKLDGIMTMGRILIPFYIWIIYLYIMISLIFEMEFVTGISTFCITVSTWSFLGALLIGMKRVMYPNLWIAVFRTVQYALYGTFWAIAIPLGFINCIKHINDIKWDKTSHLGSSGNTKPRKPLGTRYGSAGASTQ